MYSWFSPKTKPIFCSSANDGNFCREELDLVVLNRIYHRNMQQKCLRLLLQRLGCLKDHSNSSDRAFRNILFALHTKDSDLEKVTQLNSKPLQPRVFRIMCHIKTFGMILSQININGKKFTYCLVHGQVIFAAK